MNVDRYAAAESFYKLAMAFAPVPDLHIMWLLHLCDAHQEMQSWAEAAQCAVAVAGVVMQVSYSSKKNGSWIDWCVHAFVECFKPMGPCTPNSYNLFFFRETKWNSLILHYLLLCVSPGMQFEHNYI